MPPASSAVSVPSKLLTSTLTIAPSATLRFPTHWYFDVNTRIDRHTRGLAQIRSDVMKPNQLGHAESIRSDKSLEAPLLTQDSLEQPAAHVDRYAVNLVVCGHHGPHAGFSNGGLEGRQELLADDPFGDVAGGRFEAAFRLPVHGIVLGTGNNVILVDLWPPPLQAADGCHAQTGDQVRVFSEGLFGAPPACITR